MPLEQTPVRTIRIDYRCDECGIGFMRAGDTVYATTPPLYPSECNHCGAKQTLRRCYPTTATIPEGETVDLDTIEP